MALMRCWVIAMVCVGAVGKLGRLDGQWQGLIGFRAEETEECVGVELRAGLCEQELGRAVAARLVVEAALCAECGTGHLAQLEDLAGLQCQPVHIDVAAEAEASEGGGAAGGRAERGRPGLERVARRAQRAAG